MKIRTFFDPNGQIGSSRGCWCATVADQPGKREAGVSEAEAVGKLVISHPSLFGDAVVERDDRSAPHEPMFLRSSEPTD